MGEIIKVGMADLRICKSPEALTTLGLGSCIGACIYDPTAKIAGMVHFMLPDSTRIRCNQNQAKFADTGIVKLIQEMEQAGASKSRMVAKIAGGAKMFAVVTGVNMQSLNIGDNNIEAARKILSDNNIKIIAEDVGLNYGRTIEFYAEDGSLKIKAVGKEIKYI